MPVRCKQRLAGELHDNEVRRARPPDEAVALG